MYRGVFSIQRFYAYKERCFIMTKHSVGPAYALARYKDFLVCVIPVNSYIRFVRLGVIVPYVGQTNAC